MRVHELRSVQRCTLCNKLFASLLSHKNNLFWKKNEMNERSNMNYKAQGNNSFPYHFIFSPTLLNQLGHRLLHQPLQGFSSIIVTFV